MPEIADVVPHPGLELTSQASAGKLVARALVAALLGAEITSALALPWAELRGVSMALLLALPVTVVCSAVLASIAVGVERLPAALRARGVQLLLIATLGFLVFSLGAGVSNLLLIDQALKPRMLVAYAVSAVVGLLAMALFWRWLSRSAFGRALLSNAPERPLRVVMLANALVFAAFDAMFLTYGYWRFHVALLALTLAASCASSYLWLEPRRLRRWAFASALAAAVSIAPLVFSGSVQAAYDAMLRAPTSQQRLLLLARQLTDRDGDGFSKRFGGGDCDDGNRRVFPLSNKGRDCLGFMQRTAIPAVRPLPQPAAERTARPSVILLLTIDAFRCGFGRSEVPQLVDACPNLKRLAAEGQLRLDGYTTYPGTAKALLALHTLQKSGKQGERLFLGDWLKTEGYYTHALSIPGKEFAGAAAASFRSIDRSLDPAIKDPTASTAETVTDRIIEKVAEHAKPGAGPLFLWSHYLDPHAPYVQTPGSLWGLASAMDRFAAEIRRTDRAIGRLAETLAKLPNAGEVFVFVSADHGEGLGEKGSYYHGAAINDPAVRVPMLAWSPNASWTRGSGRELPSSLAEVAPYLAAVAGGAPFQSSGEAFFRAHVRGGYVFGLYRQGWKVTHHQVFGWTELYYLPNDPSESRDLSAQEPRKVSEMMTALASHLRSPVEAALSDQLSVKGL